MSHHGICTTIKKKKKKDVSMFHKDVSHWVCQKYVSTGFAPEHTKSTGFDGCMGVLGNYNIFKLKLCQNLTFAQTKNGFPSSLDSSLESKWKML